MLLADVERSVRATLPLVADRARDAERARRIPDDVVAVLQRTGMNRLLLPTAMGGLQAPVVEVMDIVESIAAVDGSTGWCAMIGLGSNLLAGYLPESGARTVFDDPDRGSASMFAPAGRLTRSAGRGQLSGRWSFASNVLHSRWIALGALVEPRDPVPRIVFAETSRLTIEDTWDSTGLRATGSHDVTADAVPVDDEHVCTSGDQPWPEGPIWRLPLRAVLVPLLASAPIGIARGALDRVARRAIDGNAAGRGHLVDDPIGIAELAIADTGLRAARAGLRTAVAEVHDLAEHHRPVAPALLARIFLAAQHATDLAVEAASVAHRLGGGAAAHSGDPLLRALHDVHAARQHLLFAHRHRSELGRALVGLDVHYPPFLP